MAHAFVTFRLRLALNALRQFAASLRGSAHIVLLVFSHALVGLFGVAALPPMYATSLPVLQACALTLAYALLMTVPLALLRQRLLPPDVLHWQRRLPVPARVRLAADALVAGLLLGPLALLFAISGTILVLQQPAWLAPYKAVPAALASLALTWLLSIAVLWLRARQRQPVRWWRRVQGAPRRYTPRMLRPQALSLWRLLFWSPFWRGDSMAGMQQSTLLFAAMGSALPWMLAPPGIARALLAFTTCVLMVVLTDRGDKAVREHAARLAPVMAAWPLQPRAVFIAARAFAALPALLVMLVVAWGGARHGLWSHTAGRAYLALGSAAPLLLVALPYVNERTRVGLVIAQILVLTAIGSELWP